MKRKDGRELVTENEVTGMDMIDYVPRGELDPPGTAISCSLGERSGTLWMDDDPSPDEFEDWGGRGRCAPR